MPANSDFDALAATTIKAYRNSLEDNIFKAMPLLAWLKGAGRKRVVNGGRTIVEQLMYAVNSTVGSYAGYEPIDTSPSEGISAADFQWKQVAGSATISGEEERKNSGKSQLINLLTSKITQLQESAMTALTTMIYGDGLGNSGKDLLGLLALVADSPTTGTVGNIDRASNVWWRNQSGTATQSATAFDNLYSAMRTRYNDCSKGSIHPDFAIADQVVYEGYESLLQVNERFTNTDEGKGGFENLKFKGLTLMFEPEIKDGGRMYMLNSANLSWVVHPDADLKMTDFVRPENQDARTAQILFMGNFVINNSARHGVISAIT